MKRYDGIALGISASLLFLAPDARGQVFKCKDAEGNLTYTDVPCLRSEATLSVDTRDNVADHSSIRKETARMQSQAAAPPPAPSPASSPEPPPPAPAPASVQRPSGY